MSMNFKRDRDGHTKIHEIKNTLLGKAEMNYIGDVLYVAKNNVLLSVTEHGDGVRFGYIKKGHHVIDGCVGDVTHFLNVFYELTKEVY